MEDMDLLTIINTVITGIITITVLILKFKNKKMESVISEQNIFIEREQEIKRSLYEKEKEQNDIIHEAILSIYDSDITIMEHIDVKPEVFERTNEQYKILKQKYIENSSAIKDILKEYDMIIDMNTEYRKQLEKES